MLLMVVSSLCFLKSRPRFQKSRGQMLDDPAEKFNGSLMSGLFCTIFADIIGSSTKVTDPEQAHYFKNKGGRIHHKIWAQNMKVKVLVLAFLYS